MFRSSNAGWFFIQSRVTIFSMRPFLHQIQSQSLIFSNKVKTNQPVLELTNSLVDEPVTSSPSGVLPPGVTQIVTDRRPGSTSSSARVPCFSEKEMIANCHKNQRTSSKVSASKFTNGKLGVSSDDQERNLNFYILIKRIFSLPQKSSVVLSHPVAFQNLDFGDEFNATRRVVFVGVWIQKLVQLTTTIASIQEKGLLVAFDVGMGSQVFKFLLKIYAFCYNLWIRFEPPIEW